MLGYLKKLVKVIATVVIGASALLAIFYTAYILIFLLIISILICIGLIIANWEDIKEWACED